MKGLADLVAKWFKDKDKVASMMVWVCVLVIVIAFLYIVLPYLPPAPEPPSVCIGRC